MISILSQTSTTTVYGTNIADTSGSNCVSLVISNSVGWTVGLFLLIALTVSVSLNVCLLLRRMNEKSPNGM